MDTTVGIGDGYSIRVYQHGDKVKAIIRHPDGNKTELNPDQMKAIACLMRSGWDGTFEAGAHLETGGEDSEHSHV